MSKEKKKKSIQKVLTRQRVQAALMFVLGLLLLNQTIQFYRFKDELAFIDSLEERNTEVIQEVSQSKEYLSSFGEDLNSIREFLLLPTKNYDFGEGDDVILSEEDTEEDLTTQLFTFVEKLGTYEKNQDRYDANLATFQTALQDGFWSEKGLTVDAGQQTSEAMVFSFKDSTLNNTEVFAVELGYDGIFSVDSLDDSWKFDDKETASSIVEELQTLVNSDLEELRAQVKTVETARASVAAWVSSQSVKDALAAKGLTVSTELATPGEYRYEFKNTDSEAVAQLSISQIDGKITLQIAKVLGDYAESMVPTDEASLLDAVQNGMDSRSERTILVDQREKEMESVFSDRAFKAVLGELELQMGVKNESDTRISYPLLRADGQTLRVIYIDKATGDVKVEMPDGTENQTLSMAIEAIDLTGKKKLSTPLWS